MSQLETALARQSGPSTAKRNSQHEVNRTLDFLVSLNMGCVFHLDDFVVDLIILESPGNYFPALKVD